MKLISIKPSTNSDKKLMATFEINGRQRTTHFGAKGYFDYTKYYKQNKELAKQKKAIHTMARHKENENWNDPTSAGSLAKNGYFGIYLLLKRLLQTTRSGFSKPILPTCWCHGC
jgi:hypothetical protein